MYIFTHCSETTSVCNKLKYIVPAIVTIKLEISKYTSCSLNKKKSTQKEHTYTLALLKASKIILVCVGRLVQCDKDTSCVCVFILYILL